MIATSIKFNTVAKVVEKGQLENFNGHNFISLKLSSERRRKINGELVVENDLFWARFFSTGADIINDEVEVGDSMDVSGQIRMKKGPEFKIDHFEIYKST